MPLVDRLDGLPVQAKKASYLKDRNVMTETGDTLGQPPGDPGIRIQPVQVFELGPTERTLDPPSRDPKPGLSIKDGQVPNETKLQVMAPVYPPAAAATAKRISLIRPQIDPDLGPGAAQTRLKTLNFTDGISFPLTEERDKLEIGHGSLLHIWGFGRFHDSAVLPLSISEP